MKTKSILLPVLAAIPVALLCTSCIEDDWDDDYYGTRRGPRYGYYDRYDDYDDYDDGYRAGYEDRRREERYDRRRDDRHRRGDDRGSARPHIPKGFVRAGSYSAGGAVEAPIPTSNTIKQVLIAATSGTVSVNTMVLREGGAKKSYTVSARLAAGQTRMIELGGRHQATGIRVSTGGKGTFDVYVH
jgi:hypothetical protein